MELNPVRAGLSADPGQFGWSSFRCNALGRADDLVSPHSLYMELGRAEEARRAAYRRLFEDDLEAPTLAAIRHAAARGWALGGEKFCRLLERQSGRPAAIRKAGRPRGARSGHAIEEITAPN